MTLHAEPGKKGTNLDKAKYDQMAQAITDVLAIKSMTTTELLLTLEKRLKKFDGKIGWYMMAVKLDLEARSVIEHSRKTKIIKLL